MYKFDRKNFFSMRNVYNTNEISKLLIKIVLNKRFSNNFDILDVSSLKTLKKNSVLFLDQDLNSPKNKILSISFFLQIKK